VKTSNLVESVKTALDKG